MSSFRNNQDSEFKLSQIDPNGQIRFSLNQEVVNGNQLNSVEPNSTVENKLKRKKSENVTSLPKSKKTKIEEMKLFKANYF